ncbi:MAG TPA: hypothetical protein VEY92_02145 [Pseudoxanthomonas sp.]|nr:hypothetical protein [Pseudoxanthomonas sp.]
MALRNERAPSGQWLIHGFWVKGIQSTPPVRVMLPHCSSRGCPLADTAYAALDLPNEPSGQALRHPLVSAAAVLGLYYFGNRLSWNSDLSPGQEIDALNGVSIRFNGGVNESRTFMAASCMKPRRFSA